MEVDARGKLMQWLLHTPKICVVNSFSSSLGLLKGTLYIVIDRGIGHVCMCEIHFDILFLQTTVNQFVSQKKTYFSILFFIQIV